MQCWDLEAAEAREALQQLSPREVWNSQVLGQICNRIQRRSEKQIIPYFIIICDNDNDYGDAIVTLEPWHLIEGPGLEHKPGDSPEPRARNKEIQNVRVIKVMSYA